MLWVICDRYDSRFFLSDFQSVLTLMPQRANRYTMFWSKSRNKLTFIENFHTFVRHLRSFFSFKLLPPENCPPLQTQLTSFTKNLTRNPANRCKIKHLERKYANWNRHKIVKLAMREPQQEKKKRIPSSYHYDDISFYLPFSFLRFPLKSTFCIPIKKARKVVEHFACKMTNISSEMVKSLRHFECRALKVWRCQVNQRRLRCRYCVRDFKSF